MLSLFMEVGMGITDHTKAFLEAGMSITDHTKALSGLHCLSSRRWLKNEQTKEKPEVSTTLSQSPAIFKALLT